MRWGRVIAYAVLAVALATGGLACESSPTIGGLGPPAASGPGAVAAAKGPSVTSVAPRTGTEGSDVTISGTGLTSAKAVCFGRASSSSYQASDSGMRITAVVPAGSGTVQVAVITAAGTSKAVSGDTFTYSGSALVGKPASPAALCASVPAASP